MRTKFTSLMTRRRSCSTTLIQQLSHSSLFFHSVFTVIPKFARVPRGNDNDLTVSGDEFDFVGDLQSVSVCHFSVFSSVHPLTSMSIQVIPLGPHLMDSFISSAHPPYVHLSGLALNCNKEKATFTLDINMWVLSLIKTEQNPPRRASASFLCHIEDSPKYKNSPKPTPYEKRFVTVHGYITGVIYNNGSEDPQEGIEGYIVAVKLIDFLGSLAEPSGGKAGSAILNKLDAGEQYFFSFDLFTYSWAIFC